MIPPVIDDDFTVIIDTNVLVQAFLRDLLFNLAKKGVFTLRLSEGILREGDRVLRQEPFNCRPETVDWLFFKSGSTSPNASLPATNPSKLKATSPTKVTATSSKQLLKLGPTRSLPTIRNTFLTMCWRHSTWKRSNRTFCWSPSLTCTQTFVEAW